MKIIASKADHAYPDPLSIRPEPNRRYENVTEAELIDIGARIITAKRAVQYCEDRQYVSSEYAALLTEWRRTLRMLQTAKKAARKTAQMRLF